MTGRVMAISLLAAIFVSIAQAQTPGKLKDFRGTPQTVALIGASSEFVDPAQKEAILQILRRQMNRYTRSYGESSISAFKLGVNTNDQFYRPVVGQNLNEQQKLFLKAAAKENSIDIIALSSIRETGDQVSVEVELQLFDARIETLSAIEKVQVNRAQLKPLDDLAYRSMNYLDKDGFVHPTPQDILERPIDMQTGSQNTLAGSPLGSQQEFSVNPTDLGAGPLGGQQNIGGDKVPFWEKWWFWALVGGGLATAGGVSYYFLVIEKDKAGADIKFNLP